MTRARLKPILADCLVAVPVTLDVRLVPSRPLFDSPVAADASHVCGVVAAGCRTILVIDTEAAASHAVGVRVDPVSVGFLVADLNASIAANPIGNIISLVCIAGACRAGEHHRPSRDRCHSGDLLLEFQLDYSHSFAITSRPCGDQCDDVNPRSQSEQCSPLALSLPG